MRALAMLLAVALAGCLGAAPQDGGAEPQGPGPVAEPLTEAWMVEHLPAAPVPFDDLAAAARALAASPRVRLSEEGASLEGRPLLGLFLSEGPAEGKPTVFLTGSQHGNEPAGSDAVLLLATYYAWGDDVARSVLERVNLYLLLCANPDGRVLEQRGNADGTDVNRDHMNLATPEARALHAAYVRVDPAIVLDLHQFGGGADLPVGNGNVFEVGIPQDPFAHPGLLAASAELAEAVREAVDGAFGPGAALVYPPTDSSQGGSIHRNHYALHNSASLLFEASVGLDAYEDQVRLQVVASQAVLRLAAAEPQRFADAHAEAETEPAPPGLRAWLAPPHARLEEWATLLAEHALNASLADAGFMALGVAEDGGAQAVRTDFPAGTLVVPAAQTDWRAALELVESTPVTDSYYTTGPRSLGLAVYEQVEP